MLLDRIKQSKNIFYFLLGGLVILLLFAGLFFAGSGGVKQEEENLGLIKEITIENDSGKLKIKRNGVVEVTAGERVFYQFWDQGRVNELFSLLNTADFSSFGSSLKPGEQGYLLTLETGSGTITIAIADTSELIPGVIEELIGTLEELVESLIAGGGGGGSPAASAVFNFSSPAASSATPAPSVLPTVSPSPSPLATPVASIVPSPTPGTGGSINPLVPFVCDLTDLNANINILSETICNLVE